MNNTIRTRGNLSAPGNDYLTNPIIKLERRGGTGMLIELMKTLLNTGICPIEWRSASTILVYKGGE